MFAISLSSCSRYNANFKLDQSVLAIHDSPLYFEISENDHPWTVTRDHWWTLDFVSDFANAFLSPGVNSRAELVPSHGAHRHWLGDYYLNSYNLPLIRLSRTPLPRNFFISLGCSRERFLLYSGLHQTFPERIY
jgi:hypothetical protein